MTGANTIASPPAQAPDTAAAAAPGRSAGNGAETVFGSTAVPAGPLPVASASSPALPPSFGLYMLAVLTAYCITATVCRPGRRRHVRAKSDVSSDGLKPFRSVLGFPAAVTGFLAAGTAAVKAATVYGGTTWAGELPAWTVAGAPLLLGLTAFAVALIQAGVLKTIGTVCYCREFTYKLTLVKADTFRLTVLFSTPLLLISGMAGGTAGKLLWCAYLTSAAIGASIFLVRSLRLYAEEKISVLLWFLYLCTLEVIPVWAIVKTVRGII